MRSSRLKRRTLGKKKVDKLLKEIAEFSFTCILERAHKAGIRVHRPSISSNYRAMAEKRCPCCNEHIYIRVVKYLDIFGRHKVRAVCDNGLCGWCEDSTEYM